MEYITNLNIIEDFLVLNLFLLDKIMCIKVNKIDIHSNLCYANDDINCFNSKYHFYTF